MKSGSTDTLPPPPSIAPPTDHQPTIRLLGEEATYVVEGARTTVAMNLKGALHTPLQEICHVVVEAKCPRLTSLRKLRATVEGECAKWIRRNEAIGATLSQAMVKRVLGLFVDTDLAACKAQVRRPFGWAVRLASMDGWMHRGVGQ